MGYPTPFSVSPIGSEHTHTFIILHGKGSNGERFGREFLDSANLPARLPTVKFVFPTASKRRSTVLKRIPINQWFDNYSLDDPNRRTDLQVDGLMETAKFLRELIDTEARILDGVAGETGYRRVIVGGLSQGCAAAIFTLLGGGLGESSNERPGAFFGMSGWLPFERQLNTMMNVDEITKDDKKEDDQDDEDSETDEESGGRSNSVTGCIEEPEESESSDDEEDEEDDGHLDSEFGIDVSFGDAESNTFASDVGDSSASFDPFQPRSQEDYERSPQSSIMDAINHVRDILDMEPVSITESSSTLQIPIFLGHGSADPKVSVHLGEIMVKLLSERLKMDVTWKAYEGFGHWYKVPDEIDDVLDFLRQKVELPVVVSSSHLIC